MSDRQRVGPVLGACFGLLIAGAALGQSGKIDAIKGYTSDSFTYTSRHTGSPVVTNGGLVHVSAAFVKPAGMALLGLTASVKLPPGWEVDYVRALGSGLFDSSYPNGAGSDDWVAAEPEYDLRRRGFFIYTGPSFGPASLRTTIKLNFKMYVPPGETGDKQLSIVWSYTPHVPGAKEFPSYQLTAGPCPIPALGSQPRN
jgi:hypothetical protein